MLTKTDLKQITSIVQKESEKTRKEFRSENRTSREEMKKEFAQVNKKLDKTAEINPAFPSSLVDFS